MHSVLAQWTGTNGLVGAVSVGAIWAGLWPYLLMIAGFSVIVFVHELGHFAVAKWAGVRVERFAIGFGRELVGFSYGETRYSFNVLPLGGYVKMLGQEDFDDKTSELQFKDDPSSFVNKPVGHRMAIVSAGVIMNTLFAFFLFMVIFMIGMEAVGTTVGQVVPDSPADKAGLLAGDKIKEINGERVLEFNEVRMGILLAEPHQPIEFLVDRAGVGETSVFVTPDYRRPQSTAGFQRLTVGILPGVTRTIAWVGPAIDRKRSDQPRINDVIVEMDGVAVTDENINQLQASLATAKEIWVERLVDPESADGPKERVRVQFPPQLALYPSDATDPETISLLGFTPLVRFSFVEADERAGLAGLEVGDTVLEFDDIEYPSRAAIARSVRHNAERDIFFKVMKADGAVVTGFVRPKTNRHGAATVQATTARIPKSERTAGGAKVRITDVRPWGCAGRAGLRAGDEVLLLAGQEFPTFTQVNKLIRSSRGKSLPIVVRRADDSRFTTSIKPQAPGSIEAEYRLVADNLLRTGRIVKMINGKLSPAATAGIPTGAKILAVAGETVTTWQQLIGAFQTHAGTTVDLVYEDAKGASATAAFTVPHCLRTKLGIGPEAHIVSVDGKTTSKTSRGEAEVQIGYHEGLRTALASLVGRKNVAVEFRANAVAPLETKYVDVTEDMVDPWLARVAFAPNVVVKTETQLLKGANAFDAISIGVHKTYSFIEQVYVTIKRMVVSRSVGVENLSGPLGIVSMGGDIARAGFVKFLYFMAIISANLAVINFLPLPIVDGGLMVFLIIEKIKGSPVSIRVQVATQMIGVFLLLGCFLFVTYNDALRIWG